MPIEAVRAVLLEQRELDAATSGPLGASVGSDSGSGAGGAGVGVGAGAGPAPDFATRLSLLETSLKQCNEAIALVRDEMRKEPAGAVGGPVCSPSFLFSHFSFISPSFLIYSEIFLKICPTRLLWSYLGSTRFLLKSAFRFSSAFHIPAPTTDLGFKTTEIAHQTLLTNKFKLL